MTSEFRKGLQLAFSEASNDILDNLVMGENIENNVISLSIDEIIPNPAQPRKEFSNDKLKDLADSIATYGIITPLIVTKEKDGKYFIIAGERRWRAAKSLGLSEIPVIIMDFTAQQKEEIALIDNIQRENLSTIEEAKAFELLMKRYKYTQEELAEKIGKSREYISNVVRLLKLPETIQIDVDRGDISTGHARTLINVENDEIREKIVKDIKEKNLSVRETEKLTKEYKNDKKKIDYNEIREVSQLKEYLDRNVWIKGKNITIPFNNENDLIEIIKKITKG